MKEISSESKYQEIAYHIAKRIEADDIKENSKLSGRTLLASEYNVSSETIRKAIHLLSVRHIVDVVDRSGIIVTSKKEAKRYVLEYKTHQRTKRLVEETDLLFEKVSKDHKMLQQTIKKLLGAASERPFPFEYMTFVITDACVRLGLEIGSRAFYEGTQTVVIAIGEDQMVTVAPDPKTLIRAGMTLYVLKTEDTPGLMAQFMGMKDA